MTGKELFANAWPYAALVIFCIFGMLLAVYQIRKRLKRKPSVGSMAVDSASHFAGGNKMARLLAMQESEERLLEEIAYDEAQKKIVNDRIKPRVDELLARMERANRKQTQHPPDDYYSTHALMDEAPRKASAQDSMLDIKRWVKAQMAKEATVPKS